MMRYSRKTSSTLYAVLFCAGSIFTVPALYAQRNIQFRTPREAVTYYENLVGTLTRQVRSMQDENAMNTAALQVLQRKVSAMEAEQKTLRSELLQLRKQLSADAESRKAQFNALADQIVKQSSPAPAARKRRSAHEQVRKETVQTAAAQEFIEHTVEPGTTLSALSRAYKVPLQEIIKVNKIKKGRIYAGQKLLIPVPKKH